MGRIGGEEFAFILKETGLEEARALAESLREQIASTCISTPSEAICFTASFGIAVAELQDKLLDDELQRADEALYRAKDGGRDCVEV